MPAKVSACHAVGLETPSQYMLRLQQTCWWVSGFRPSSLNVNRISLPILGKGQVRVPMLSWIARIILLFSSPFNQHSPLYLATVAAQVLCCLVPLQRQRGWTLQMAMAGRQYPPAARQHEQRLGVLPNVKRPRWASTQDSHTEATSDDGSSGRAAANKQRDTAKETLSDNPTDSTRTPGPNVEDVSAGCEC